MLHMDGLHDNPTLYLGLWDNIGDRKSNQVFHETMLKKVTPYSHDLIG